MGQERTDDLKPDTHWSVATLAHWAQGQLSGANDGICYGVSTDTRKIKTGDLFVALKGEHFDGHEFIDQAVAKGAAALMVMSPLDESLELAADIAVIQVADTRIALGDLARNHRRQLKAVKLVAVTGSNGKTTVKAMLAHILSAQGSCLATQGNLNNDLGVPLTLLNMHSGHEYAVIEMGANHPKEIDYLTHIAQPDVALITLAAGAHLEGFGSLQGVIETKGEIFNGLSPQGTGIVNVDSPGADLWQAALAERGLMTFAQKVDADVRVVAPHQTPQGLKFELQYQGQNFPVLMPVLGLHNAMNAAAAVSVCLVLDLKIEQVLPSLADFSGVQGRLQTYSLAQGVLIDDSYNANPHSVKAAIDTLVALDGRAVLCWGAMAELGAETQAAHEDIGRYARQQGVDDLLSYGDATQAGQRLFNGDELSKCYDDHETLLAALQQILACQQGGVNVLVKGSRSAQMDAIVKMLLKEIDHARLS